MRPHKIFLDLEDTIITNWDEGTLINVAALRDHWSQMVVFPQTVSIFSFAIWSPGDKDHFEQQLKGPIERALGVTIDEWMSVQEMQKIVEEWQGMQYTDVADFLQMNGKHGAFEKVCLARESNCTCTLFDDAVPHRSILDVSRDLVINLWPIQIVTGQPLLPVQRKL